MPLDDLVRSVPPRSLSVVILALVAIYGGILAVRLASYALGRPPAIRASLDAAGGLPCSPCSGSGVAGSAPRSIGPRWRCGVVSPGGIPQRMAMMAEGASWEEIKGRRADSVQRRKGYEAAKAAFEWGERIRSERERLGLTEAELADRMGSTQPAVARLEAGGVTPSLDTLGRVAEAFGGSGSISAAAEAVARCIARGVTTGSPPLTSPDASMAGCL
jgi:DNA-binding XRE family transcriptional regulator